MLLPLHANTAKNLRRKWNADKAPPDPRYQTSHRRVLKPITAKGRSLELAVIVKSCMLEPAVVATTGRVSGHAPATDCVGATCCRRFGT